MAVKILLTLLLLAVALEVGFAQCQCGGSLCPAIQNTSPCCVGMDIRYQCICDFTCSKWDRPCNWALTCPEEIANINDVRRAKNKLIVFRLPNRTHKECLEININSHKEPNCCSKFCGGCDKDVCF